MRRPLTMILSFILLSMATHQVHAQYDLEVVLNKHQFMPGDTIEVSATFSKDGKPYGPATLQLVLEDENKTRRQYRWPILSGKVEAEMIIADKSLKGPCKLYFGANTQFFSVTGKEIYQMVSPELNAMLITPKGDWLYSQVPLNDSNRFTINNWLFEDEATLVFSGVHKNDDPINMSIETPLDSSVVPVATWSTQVFIGKMDAAMAINTAGKKDPADLAVFMSDTENSLPEVIVTGKRKFPIEVFKERHVSPMFTTVDERSFDLLNDPNANKYMSIDFFLLSRIPGFQNKYYSDGSGRTYPYWRGATMQIFLDEMPVSIEDLRGLNIADLALVKVFPPPFTGARWSNSGANVGEWTNASGGIALYTKRGGNDGGETVHRHVFRVKGYTPLTVLLN